MSCRAVSRTQESLGWSQASGNQLLHRCPRGSILPRHQLLPVLSLPKPANAPSGVPGNQGAMGRPNNCKRTLPNPHFLPSAVHGHKSCWASGNSLPTQELDALLGRESSSQHRKQLFWRLSHAGHMGMPYRQPGLNSREWFNLLPNSTPLPCSPELGNAQLHSPVMEKPIA